MKQTQQFLSVLVIFLCTNSLYSQAKLEVKSDGKVQMDHSGTNILELRDGATLRGYIQHDGTNLSCTMMQLVDH